MKPNSYIKNYLKDDKKDKSKKKRNIIIIMLVLLCLFNPIDKIRKTIYLNVERKKEENDSVSLKKTYKMPIKKGKMFKDYGNLPLVGGNTEYHSGIDFVCYDDSSVETIEEGIVVFSGYDDEYGNCVEVKHKTKEETFYTFYAKLSSTYVSVGQTLSKRQTIGKLKEANGYSDSTNYAILHFEVRKNKGRGNEVNPKKYIYCYK